MKINLTILFFLAFFITASCQVNKDVSSDTKTKTTKVKKKKKKKKKVKLPNIDLSHWKITVPISNEKGKPYEVEPPEILDYANNDLLKPYMYNDSVKGAIVFYAKPTSSTTRNTKYSRSELREQMEPGSNSVNWTFPEGGRMKGKLSIGKVSKDSKGKYHKVIIMQIHGRLTNEQRDLIGEDDNNAPPILKIYWQNGKIRVKTKVLRNPNLTDTEILHEKAWTDDNGFNFEEEVGFNKFTLEVKASDGKLVVSLNGNEYKVYKNNSIKRWGIFENYFKAGNYFQTRDEGSYAEVKYYELEVEH